MWVRLKQARRRKGGSAALQEARKREVERRTRALQPNACPHASKPFRVARVACIAYDIIALSRRHTIAGKVRGLSTAWATRKFFPNAKVGMFEMGGGGRSDRRQGYPPLVPGAC